MLEVLVAVVLAGAAAAQTGTVESEQEISRTSGGFGGDMNSFHLFGAAVRPVRCDVRGFATRSGAAHEPDARARPSGPGGGVAVDAPR
jgi:hypothetical protein